jgi:transcriptional regulator with XRE-family HTH domain
MVEEKEETFGVTLINARVAMGKSLGCMASTVGISSTQLVKYERNQVQKPQERTLRSICDAYGVDYKSAESNFYRADTEGKTASADIAKDFQDIVHGKTGRGVWETQQAMRHIFEACAGDVDLMEEIAKKINSRNQSKKKIVRGMVNS